MGDLSLELVLDEASAACDEAACAYLQGATHDGTFSRTHGTARFCQSDRRWLEILRVLLGRINASGWIYREGKRRNVWVLETCWRPPARDLTTVKSQLAYVRAYFDTEGGIPRDPEARFYIQFVQKDRRDIEEVHSLLGDLDISCGRLHNPSRSVDPDYWRFFVSSRSHSRFLEAVSSWHPRKRALLDLRRPTSGQTILSTGGSGSEPS